MTKKTFDTFASDWTQCTNVAFDKILKKFQLQNSNHKVRESGPLRIRHLGFRGFTKKNLTLNLNRSMVGAIQANLRVFD